MALKAKGMDDTAYGLRRDRKEKAQERGGGPAKGTTERAWSDRGWRAEEDVVSGNPREENTSRWKKNETDHYI